MRPAVIASAALLCLLLPRPAPAGPDATYLLLSHDPGFLSAAAGFTEPAVSKGRARLVKLAVPAEDVPPEIFALMRETKPADIYQYSVPPPARLAPDPAVAAVLKEVDPSRLMGFAEAITMTGRRSVRQLDLSPTSGNRAAMDYIAKAFTGMGYETERQCYKTRGADKECNILARRRAAGRAAKAVLVVGHMDSVGHENAGADDNASGASGVLEMARVLAGFSSDHDLIFVAANGEESGIAGSYACAKALRASGELSRVAWAINMDMIAWNRDGRVDIETNKEHAAYAEWVSSLAHTYTKLKPNISMPAWGSDHVPFLEAGIPTYLSIESWNDHNPCYHAACDTMEKLSWSYAADIVRLNLAVVAGKARLSPLSR